MSLIHQEPDAVMTADFADDLRNTYNISPWLLLVPVLTGVLIVKKVPAILTLFIAALMAGIVAVFVQPQIIGAVAGGGAPVHGHQLDFMEGIKGMYMSYYGPTAIDTGNEALNELVSTGGMTGMLNTIFLIISAVTFGGALVGSGMLQTLTEKLTQFIRRRVAMVSATVGTGIFANMITGDQYLSIILTSSLYKNLYRQKGYEPKLLSRSVEDSATVVSVLIPWNSCGMTQSTVLNVSTMTYLPYCLFNIISPIMSIIIAAIGYKIVKKSK
jgi:NhaC family Na+:H+ antiporter